MTEEAQLNLFSFTPSINDQIPTDAKIPIPPNTYQNLEELSNHCRSCHRCELGNNRLNPVIGRGNPQSSIMIIGEAPGEHEDQQGLPFVGRSGQLLDKILASVQIRPTEDVYICNVIRCRPPNNRVPNSTEIAACKPYLLEQIRLINPQIILLTGTTALKTVTGKKDPISKIRGTWITWENRLCMPIFHPSYLLRNPSREVGSPKWLMWQDIQQVKAKLDEINGINSVNS